VYIRPTVTGYVEKFHYDTSYSKFSGILYYGRHWHPPLATWTDHAFLKFSLDSMPDTCVILDAELHYYQYEHSGGLPVVDIRLIRDPVPLSAQDLFFEIESASAVTFTGQSPDSWVTWNINPSAYPLLDSCRDAGCASFGIHWDGPTGYMYTGTAYGYDSGDPPYLRIEYTSSGTREAPGILARQPELALAPNPATSRFVMARYDIAAGTRDNLVLRGVLGRYVQSFALDPSGITELDLRRLSPGVYIATLRTTGQSVSRKLVITR